MEDGNIVTQVFLPVSLAFIMFSVGLALTGADFKRVLVQPKDFMIGAMSQVVLLPAVAFAIVSFYQMEPALAVGVMIIAACPGGVTSNIMTHMAKGDTALSVSLTAVISLLSVFTLPLIVGMSVTHLMGEAAPEMDVVKVAGGSFAIVAVPVMLGMLVRKLAERFAIGFEKIARHLATVLFIVIIAGAIYTERNNIAAYFAQSGVATLTLNIVMMALAYAIAKGFGLGSRQQTAITLECGLQNGTLAIFVAVTLIGNTTMMIPGAIYSLLMFATAGLYLPMAMRRAKAALQGA